MAQAEYTMLQRPYPIIFYGKEVAMQIGTQVDENGIHPVVKYNRKNKKVVIWDQVELGQVTTLCIDDDKVMAWRDFERLVDIRLFNSMMDEDMVDVLYAFDLHHQLLGLGIKVALPPTSGVYDQVLARQTELDSEMPACRSTVMEVSGFGNDEMFALAGNFPMWTKIADEEQMFDILHLEVRAYQLVVGSDLMFHFGYHGEEMKSLAERLNKWMGVK